jgi:hypothetical protein
MAKKEQAKEKDPRDGRGQIQTLTKVVRVPKPAKKKK